MATTSATKKKGAARKPAGKDYTKYNFEGEVLGKSRLVLAVVQAAAKNSKKNILSMFPKKETKAVFEVVAPIRKADKGRYFTNKEDRIQGKYVVSNQWDSNNIENFIEFAKDLGFSIRKMTGHNGHIHKKMEHA